MTENEMKLRKEIEENEALEKLYHKKLGEEEKINYKHSKAQSEILEIMRDLSKFRGEFFDNYSIRSKLLKAQEVHDKIEIMMTTQSDILKGEVTKLDYFVESS